MGSDHVIEKKCDAQVHAWLEALEDASGQPMSLWCRDELWNCVAGHDVSSLPWWGGRSLTPGEPLAESADSAWYLAVPFQYLGRMWAAAGRFEQADPDRLLALARMSLREWTLRDEVSRLAEENDSLVVQVSDDFEELAFLRSIAGELELTSGSYSLTHIMSRMLPLLRQTIGAESIVILGAALHHEPFARPESETEDEWHHMLQAMRFHDGPLVLDECQCRALVERSLPSGSVRTCVQNHVTDLEWAGEFPKLREYLLVPVSKDDRLHGWMLVLNRQLHQLDEPSHYWQQTRLEFGTAEASVARTAATLLASHAQNVELFQQKEQLLTDMVRALVNAIEAKDEYTRGHSERVALFARRMGEALDQHVDACDRIHLTGLLHDVGKIAVDDATLRKPDRLSDVEYDMIQRHPDSGWTILQGLEHLRFVLPGVLHHHEKFDGSGYPDGLVGEAIPLDGRILAICDAYDAMTSNRPYRKGMPQEKAEAILRDGAGTYWDPKLVEVFFEIMPEIIAIRENFQPRQTQPRRPKE
ncbi:MAG: HD domain-containing protein [Planctomycetales bacterium]|nr:HD domain-containing protein [Planctomycetales bacterium]